MSPHPKQPETSKQVNAYPRGKFIHVFILLFTFQLALRGRVLLDSGNSRGRDMGTAGLGGLWHH